MAFDYIDLAEQLGVDGLNVTGEEAYGRCPLHSDSSPSFSLKVETGEWTCWAGCGPEKGRSFVRLVQEVLGISFLEAQRWVSRNGHHTDAQALNDQIVKMLSISERSFEVKDQQNDPAAYYMTLPDNIMPQDWFQRGFSWVDADIWGARYDAKREAIVLPVYDGRAIVGYVQRNLRTQPKYLNAKGVDKQAFGIWHCRPQEPVVLVEGPLDAVWLYKHGYNAVAMFGTTVSDQQIRALAALPASEVVLGLDSDPAGRAGEIKAAKKLSQSQFGLHQISALRWPRKDAQECDVTELEHAFTNRKRWLEMEIDNARSS